MVEEGQIRDGWEQVKILVLLVCWGMSIMATNGDIGQGLPIPNSSEKGL